MEKKYEVISFFTDLRDYDYPYNVGDIFPRQGVEVSAERLEELSSNRNKQGRPLIRLVGGETAKAPAAPVNPSGDVPPAATEPQTSAVPPATDGDTTGDGTGGDNGQTAPATADSGKKIYTEAELKEMKVPEIRELAQSLGFKCSSTSKVDIIAEFMQKQQG